MWVGGPVRVIGFVDSWIIIFVVTVIRWRETSSLILRVNIVEVVSIQRRLFPSHHCSHREGRFLRSVKPNFFDPLNTICTITVKDLVPRATANVVEIDHVIVAPVAIAREDVVSQE